MTPFEGHTPGPWRAVDDVGRNHYCPRGLDARPPQPCPHDLDNDGSWSIDGPPHTDVVGGHDTSLARRVDAELGAAAPDLLAILRHMLKGHDPTAADRFTVKDRVSAARPGVSELTEAQCELLHRIIDRQEASDGSE